MRGYIRKAAFVMLTLLACGWPERPDFTLGNGLAVSTHTTQAAWAHESTFPAALETLTTDAVAWWGGEPGTLRGWELVLQDERPCGDDTGCEEGLRDAMEVYVGDLYAECFPQVGYVVWHEIGHVIIGDSDHTDPRWTEIPVPAGGCVMPAPSFHRL